MKTREKGERAPIGELVEHKQTWLQALESYRQWNEAVFADRVRNAGQRTPLEKRHIYLDLLRFWEQINGPERSKARQQRESTALQTYYDRVRRLEEWRFGKSTRKGLESVTEASRST